MRQGLFLDPRDHGFFHILGAIRLHADEQMRLRLLGTGAASPGIDHQRHGLTHIGNRTAGHPLLRRDSSMCPLAQFFQHPGLILADHFLDGADRRGQRSRHRHAGAVDFQTDATPPATPHQFVIDTPAIKRDAALVGINRIARR